MKKGKQRIFFWVAVPVDRELAYWYSFIHCMNFKVTKIAEEQNMYLSRLLSCEDTIIPD